ncbi:hypothetical protein CPB84DRAFT_1824974 [Gymnopilus junonius]|uniref:Uncharacterized protein n=1 Tax=Gymnopilus junonius TaxID=109634 RepID=A0A9P5NQN8_GYMJU|nr:hypothetical protein CPB84DRAFT_1824974 [Gymnopilus junonius]
MGDGRHYHPEKDYYVDKMLQFLSSYTQQRIRRKDQTYPDPKPTVRMSSAPEPVNGSAPPAEVNPSSVSTSYQPPSIFVFNVGRTRTSQINDGPSGERSLLESFVKALDSIRAKGYIVQGAMYGPEGVNIFIDTEDEDCILNLNYARKVEIVPILGPV